MSRKNISIDSNRVGLVFMHNLSKEAGVKVQPETITLGSKITKRSNETESVTNDGNESNPYISTLSANVDERNESSINVKLGKIVQSQVSSQIVSIPQENNCTSLPIGVGPSPIYSGSTQPLSVKYPAGENRTESWNVKGQVTFLQCRL